MGRCSHRAGDGVEDARIGWANPARFFLKGKVCQSPGFQGFAQCDIGLGHVSDVPQVTKQAQQAMASARPALDISNVVAAFSEEQIERIVGLSKGRLRYWAKTDFFKPSFAGENPRMPYTRFYSFRDMVALRTLEMLRVQNGVPLQKLRKVADKLTHLKAGLWAQTTLFVVKGEVVFVNPETGKPEEIVSGQYVLGIPLKKVIEDTEADVASFTKRRAETIGKITRTHGVVQNRAVVSGTRIPVAAIVRLREDGYSDSAIIDEYPDLTAADIRAALKHDPRKVA